jgi:thioredoxin 1
MSDVITLEDGTFAQEVLKSDTPVLVDFWAPWCAPCKAIAPYLDTLAAKYKGKLKIGKMDVDQFQGVPEQFQVRSLPTLLLFKGGRVVDTLVVTVDKTKLEDSIRKVLG